MTMRTILLPICMLAALNFGYTQSKKPNVIVIVADDLGYAVTSSYSQAKDWIKTPNIDRIGHEGVRFTNAYVTASVCAPSRAGLMTGRYQQRFGIYANADSQTGTAVPASEKMMAWYFKQEGYKTAAIGKWHMGIKLPGQHPLDRGFDKYFGFNSAQTDYFNSPILFDGRNKVLTHDYLTFEFTKEAIEFIDDEKDNPFFLYLAYNAVHGPNQAPDAYIKKLEHMPKGPARLQAAMTLALDDAIGNLLAKLKEEKIDDNTLVFFISDNGGLPYWWKGSNDPLKGFKRDQWDGGHKVQFMARWPSGISKPSVVEENVSSLDILPTAMQAAGIKMRPAYDLDGTSLLPLCSHGNKQAFADRSLFWAGSHIPQTDEEKEAFAIEGEYHHDNPPPAWAVRKGKWKLIQVLPLGAPKLYDLDIDGSEQNDVSSQHPDLVKKMQGDFVQWFKGMKVPITWKMEYFKRLSAIK